MVVLELAGIRQARVIVFAISDPFATRLAVRVARRINDELVVLTRTKYVADMDELWDIGSTEVIAEEFEAALELVTRILRVYNAPRALVAAEIKSIRDQRFGIFRERSATVPRIRLRPQVCLGRGAHRRQRGGRLHRDVVRAPEFRLEWHNRR